MRTLYEHTCKKCTHVFKSTNKEQTYCSPACYNDSRVSTQIEKICPICEQAFWVYPSHDYQVHCSTKCYLEGLSLDEELVHEIEEVKKAIKIVPEEKVDRFKPVVVRRCTKCHNRFRQGIYEKQQELCTTCR